MELKKAHVEAIALADGSEIDEIDADNYALTRDTVQQFITEFEFEAKLACRSVAVEVDGCRTWLCETNRDGSPLRGGRTLAIYDFGDFRAVERD